MSLSDQKTMKEQASFDVFKRIGKIEYIETLYDEWIPSQALTIIETMEYSFSCIHMI